MLRIICTALIGAFLFGASASAQTLGQIASTKILRIGFISDQAPFAARDGGNVPAGYAIDLCSVVVEAVAKNISGVKLVYVETSLVDAFGALAAGQFDLLCGAVTITLGRRELVDFSVPTFLTGMSALLRTDTPRDLKELFLGERTISPPRSPELRPFATSQVGVRADSTTAAILRRAIAEGHYGAKVTEFAGHAEGLAALEEREIDAYFADRVLLLGLLEKAREPSQLIVATRLLTQEAYGIALKRGDADFRLLVDRALSEYYATPAFMSLLRKYFGETATAVQAQLLAYSLPE